MNETLSQSKECATNAQPDTHIGLEDVGQEFVLHLAFDERDEFFLDVRKYRRQQLCLVFVILGEVFECRGVRVFQGIDNPAGILKVADGGGHGEYEDQRVPVTVGFVFGAVF
jgi:hypothetical protein